MLRQRLVTAAILLPLFLYSLFALDPNAFAVLLAVVVLLGAWEWAALMGLGGGRRIAYAALVGLALAACAATIGTPGLPQVILAGAVVWWLVALGIIQRFRGADGTDTAPAGVAALRGRWAPGLIGIAVLAPAWLAIVLVHATALDGAGFVLLLMLLVWGADSGAFFAGRRWGQRRLAPHVSPGKTWAGVYGALAVAALVAGGAGALWLGLGGAALVTLVLLGLVTVLFSIVGDLFESLAKRVAGVKDSGSLLPGHGGVLDRIDSVTAAAPVFALGLSMHGVVP